MAVRTKRSLELSPWARSIYKQKYSLEGKEEWPDTAYRVVSCVLGALGYTEQDEEFQRCLRYIVERKFIPGGRYLYASGRELHQVNNCFLTRVDDTREDWAELGKKAFMILMTGGGLGVDYSNLRPYGAPLKKAGGISSGPLPLMQTINEIGRGAIAGGSRRAAIISLLDWDHGDIDEFIHMKDWPEEIVKLKEQDQNFPAPMDMTNISVNLDDEFFEKIEAGDSRAWEVYREAVNNMITTGEPGFSINLENFASETLRNPCGEVVSADDSDVCNLGSLNFARIEDEAELHDVVDIATLFLLAGTVYSDVPYDKVKDVRAKNRRIGLGVMGIHEWLLVRGHQYGPNADLGSWLDIYAESWEPALKWAQKHSLSTPTGTLGILGETTTAFEPIFCVAYKRRYLDGKKWKYQYVVDPTARRLVDEQGVDPNDIEDAYTLSYDLERRLQMQAWIQSYVDQGVSSTINLPYQVTDKGEQEQISDLLLEYLPKLRGITMYPDQARGGQPLVPSTYSEAIKHEGTVFEEDIDASCRNGVCGA
jgi:ribonucleoside-diphosphate reductase alpha chain